MEVRESEKAAAGYRRIKRIGLAHGAGLVFYAVGVELLAAQGVNPPHPIMDLDPVRTALVIMSVVLFALAGRLRQHLLTPGLASVEQALVPDARLSRMVSVNLVVFALCDAVALFGVVLFFLGGTRQEFYIFIVLALLFLAVHFPRERQWHAWYAARGRMR